MKLDNLKQLVKEELKRALSEGRKTLPLKDLTLEDLAIMGKVAYLPNTDDSLLNLDLTNPERSNELLQDYKDELVSKFGMIILNAPVILDPSEVWYNRVVINDKNFQEEREQRSQNKMAALQGLSKD